MILEKELGKRGVHTELGIRAYERGIKKVVCTWAQGLKGAQEPKEAPRNFLETYIFRSHPDMLPTQDAGGTTMGTWQ